LNSKDHWFGCLLDNIFLSFISFSGKGIFFSELFVLWLLLLLDSESGLFVIGSVDQIFEIFRTFFLLFYEILDSGFQFDDGLFWNFNNKFTVLFSNMLLNIKLDRHGGLVVFLTLISLFLEWLQDLLVFSLLFLGEINFFLLLLLFKV